MTILTNTDVVKTTITIDENATINEHFEAFIGALIQEGFNISIIKEGLYKAIGILNNVEHLNQSDQ